MSTLYIAAVITYSCALGTFVLSYNKKDRSLPIYFIVIRFPMNNCMFTRWSLIQTSGIIGFLIPKSYVYGGWVFGHPHTGDHILLHLFTQIHGIYRHTSRKQTVPGDACIHFSSVLVAKLILSDLISRIHPAIHISCSAEEQITTKTKLLSFCSA